MSDIQESEANSRGAGTTSGQTEAEVVIEAGEAAKAPAVRTNRLAVIIFAVTAVFFVITDLWSKYAVFTAVAAPDDYHPGVHLALLTNHFRDVSWLVPHWNTGTAWSMFSSMPGLVTGLTLILLPAIIWYWWAAARGQRVASLALGGIVGGAIGNAWDRVLARFDTPGIMGVRDFIHVDLNLIGIDYIWPTFNVADMGITGGAVVLIVSQLFQRPPVAGQGAVK